MPKVLRAAREKEIGARIRLARVEARMSQTTLGQRIGVSFQQVQKYEKGRDRVAASLLHDLGEILGKPSAWFIEDRSGRAGDRGLPRAAGPRPARPATARGRDRHAAARRRGPGGAMSPAGALPSPDHVDRVVGANLRRLAFLEIDIDDLLHDQREVAAVPPVPA